MTALATETTTTANGLANGPEASQVFHVEHRCGRTGHRFELARYVVGDGEERILFGQRVDGVVRFLPDDPVVLVLGRAPSEDDTCRPRDRCSPQPCCWPGHRSGLCDATTVNSKPCRSRILPAERIGGRVRPGAMPSITARGLNKPHVDAMVLGENVMAVVDVRAGAWLTRD